MTPLYDSLLDSFYDSFLLINSRPDCSFYLSEFQELILFFTVRYPHLSVCRLYHLLSLLSSDPVVTKQYYYLNS